MALNTAQLNGIVSGSTPNIPAGASAQQAAFITQIWPYVTAESQRTGIPVEVLIVQSGVETGWGTSWLFRVAHNPAGVGAFDASHGNTFPSLAEGYSTYADRLMGIGEGGQEQFISDVRSHKDALTLLTDLQNGPWAGGHYNYSTLVNSFHSLYGGGGGSSATSGTGAGGGAASGAPGTSGQNAVLTNFLSDAASGLPVIGPMLGRIAGLATVPEKFFGLFVGIFTNWRYILEVFLGFILFGAGTLIIMADTKVVRTAGTAAAGAVA